MLAEETSFDNKRANLYYPAMFIKSPKTLFFLPLLLLAVAISASVAKAQIVVLIPPQQFIVENIVKDTETVKALLPTAQSLEHFAPSPSHLRAIETAKLYVQLGHPVISIEPLLIDKIVTEAKIPSVSMSSKITLKEYDPHYWLALSNVGPMVEAVLPALIKLHPEHEAAYKANGAALIAQAKEIKSELQTKLAPIRGRSFLVFHPSWQYFAEDLGLVELAIEQHGREPNPAALQKIINSARIEKIRCIFQEPQTSASATQAVAEMIEAQVTTLNPLGAELFTNIREAAQKILTATIDGSCS